MDCQKLTTVKFEDSDLDIALGYGQYNGQPVKKVYQNYSADPSIWTVVTANGETYEISLDADWNSFSNLAGPYPDENIQH